MKEEPCDHVYKDAQPLTCIESDCGTPFAAKTPCFALRCPSWEDIKPWLAIDSTTRLLNHALWSPSTATPFFSHAHNDHHHNLIKYTAVLTSLLHCMRKTTGTLRWRGWISTRAT